MTNKNLTTFYIVRHGESEENVKFDSNLPYVHYDELGSPLSTKGKEQARKRAISFKNISFDLAFSSDMIRAKETAEIIALEHDLAVTTTKLIRERTKGNAVAEVEKKLVGEFKSIFDKLETISQSERKSLESEYGIESREKAVSRLITYIRELAIAYPGKTILVVCHGRLISGLLIHLGIYKNNELNWDSVKNTGYFVVETDGADFFVKEMHDIKKVN
jgi:broad specificity phosphatase PhoE